MTLSLNLKPLLWITPFFYTPQQRSTVYNKNTSAAGTGAEPAGTGAACLSLCASRDEPSTGPAQNKTLPFAALGVVGSSTCHGIKEGRTSKGKGCSSKLCVSERCEVRGSLSLPLQVLCWWSLFWAGTVLPAAMPTAEHLTVCAVMICVSSLETAIHGEPQDIHLLLSFCARKGYYFESHSLQQPLQRVTLSSSANRAELCTRFNIKQGYVFN